MRVIGSATAARHPAEAPVALEDPSRWRPAPFDDGLPDLEEVRRDPRQALSRANPAPRGLPRRPERECHKARDPIRRPDLELAARAQLRLLFVLQFPPQIDARDLLGALNQRLDGTLVRLPRDEPGLLVGDAPRSHGLAKLRQLVQVPLERDALLDAAHRHAKPFGSVVLERGEPEPPRAIGRAQEQREMAEHSSQRSRSFASRRSPSSSRAISVTSSSERTGAATASGSSRNAHCSAWCSSHSFKPSSSSRRAATSSSGPPRKSGGACPPTYSSQSASSSFHRGSAAPTACAR